MTPHQRAPYLIITGPEGSGKSTALRQLQADIPQAVYTCEPGGTPLGVGIRQMLLESEHDPIPTAEFFLFMADRCQHLATVVEPARRAGKPVFSDRGFESTYAYQCYAGLGWNDPLWFVELLRQFNIPMPDAFVLVDIDPTVGLARRKQTTMNRIDHKDIEFHKRMRVGLHIFLQTLEQPPFQVPLHRINGAQDPQGVYRDLRAVVAQYLAPS